MKSKTKETKLGSNRTGMGMSPIDSTAMLENSSIIPSAMDRGVIVQERSHYIKNTGSIGTLPPPTSMKGVVSTAKEMLKGNVPMVFLDKLGQRLAFERSGSRLYELFINKIETLGELPGGPDLKTVRQFYREELSHMELVRQCIETLGADPTAVTPAANVDAVASMGLIQVLSDPRTDIPQSLHAIHIAELADNDGWEMLVQLAESIGQDQFARDFRAAIKEELVHLETVRLWAKNLAMEEATVTE